MPSSGSKLSKRVGIAEIDPGESVAGTDPSGGSLTKRAPWIPDGQLGDGAEKESASGSETKEHGQNPRCDDRPHHPGHRAGRGHRRENPVGRGDETLGKRDPFGLVRVQKCRRRPVAKHGGNLPGQIYGIADPGIHALTTDWAMNVRRVAGQKNVGFAKYGGHPVVHAIRREPIDGRYLEVEPVDHVLAYILIKWRAPRDDLIVADNSDETYAPLGLQGKHGEQIVGLIQFDMKFPVDRRTARFDVGHIEKPRIAAPGESDSQVCAHGRMGSVASREIARRARHRRRIGGAQRRADSAFRLLEGYEFGIPFDANSGVLKPFEQKPFVFVLREDE